jgi:preprotein translocase subunit SecE
VLLLSLRETGGKRRKMDKLNKRLKGFRTFFDEVLTEMRKSTWPTRDELIEQTIIVIVSVILVGFFVGVSDKVLVELLKLIIPSG